MTNLTTKRLILRPWRESDLEALIQMNGDPRVMEFLGPLRGPQECREEYQRIVKGFEKKGWGYWALSLIGGADFVGMCGLKETTITAHFTPAIEIAWRLPFSNWRHGYATEAALAALRYGFETLHLNEIVSFTTPLNVRSVAIMKRIGMRHNPKEDFDHPLVPIGDKLRRHVLYRLKQSEWKAQHRLKS